MNDQRNEMIAFAKKWSHLPLGQLVRDIYQKFGCSLFDAKMTARLVKYGHIS